MTLLYQPSAVLRSFHLPVSHGHQIHVEEYGNPEGVPVLVCHGGPGGGLQKLTQTYFNPARYRIILFSQRGCGNSSPHSLEHNNTDLLVADMLALLDYLDLPKCVIAGGSWGATLALLFAQLHTERVIGLIIWASFFAAKDDLAWLYGATGAGAQFYPERFAIFSHGEMHHERVLEIYKEQLFGEDELLQHKAAQLWLDWDQQLSVEIQLQRYQLQSGCHLVTQAKLMVHYMSARCFIEEQQLLHNAQRIAQLPIWMIHSRQDLVCRFASAQKFAEQVQARLLILEGVGHSATNKVYSEAIRRAADLLLCKIDKNRG
ncbi:proline iminopeptidase [Pseudoalteromonas luteoviolacea]|uniref:Proline iminopeptidase n=1 Tax=Pseudoalteromonas luteoviolacea TaxID=43657 RepID=A0A1C0TKW1_9GAMM|nr:alpha/beta fold hydrolase [Pseudoalteromonas luteoviolacea]MBQ4813200.1 alpha/beta fold hydrolase [Pseudoalteromonas luteoviolacea]OCQ19026.1 proline iminopeptidase [Pseudoalteromonas luteoviolacea]